MNLARLWLPPLLVAICFFGLGIEFGLGLASKDAVARSPGSISCLEALQDNQQAAAESSRLVLKAACGKFCAEAGLRPRLVTVRGHDPESFDCRCGGDL